MMIVINGEMREFKGPLTISGLLNELDIEPLAVAVEVNRTIIKKQEYEGYGLKDGDSVEIVSFVGGG